MKKSKIIITIFCCLLISSCAFNNKEWDNHNSQRQALSPNDYNNERNNEFVYIDAISSNRDHHNEYGIADLNEGRNKNPVMKKNAGNFPYYQEILEEVINALKPHGYKMYNIDDIYYKEKDSLFPAYISFSYLQNDKAVMFELRLNNYTIPSKRDNQPITVLDAVSYMKTKKNFNTTKDFNITPVWSITIGIDIDNPMNARLQLSAIIKCASPYFNTNFKGTITCKR